MHPDASIDRPRPVLPSGDATARHPAPQQSHIDVDLRLSLVRGAPALPWRCTPSVAPDELTTTEILDIARGVGERPGAFLLGGGNPVERSDLWEILAELGRLRPVALGLCTPGYGVTAAMVRRLHAAGVQRVHVPFHCARQDAHDWLVGRAGALKVAHRAIRACADAQVPVVADIVLTRPTMPHLAETVEVLTRAGVRTICVRRLTAADTEGSTFVPLSPRLSLLGDSLERAATVALEQRARFRLRGLPLCAAPRLRALFVPPGGELWALPDGEVVTRDAATTGCPDCPGLPRCAGAPRDYTERFGWEEIFAVSPRLVQAGDAPSIAPTTHADGPMVFTWRGPRHVGCEACADSHDAAAPTTHEPSRTIRARLVQAAGYRPPLLRLVGADLLAHPDAAALTYDAVRLFDRVDIAAEGSPLAEWSDLDLRRIKDLHRLDVALYGPDAAAHDAHCGAPGAFDAMLRGIERVHTFAGVTVGAYAVVHDAGSIPAFAAAWARGDLPGEPRFRLSPRGASLDDLIACARTLPPGPGRAALLAVLPRCACEAAGLPIERHGDTPACAAPQHTVHCGRHMPYHPCGSDPIGAFASCRVDADACAVSDCVGTAVGWHRAARSGQWTASA